MGLTRECLYRGDGIQNFSSHGAGIGDFILAGTRHFAHASTQCPERQHNNGKQNNHHTREPSTRHQHHGHATNQHDQAAQCNRYARAYQGLH